MLSGEVAVKPCFALQVSTDRFAVAFRHLDHVEPRFPPEQKFRIPNNIRPTRLQQRYLCRYPVGVASIIRIEVHEDVWHPESFTAARIRIGPVAKLTNHEPF